VGRLENIVTRNKRGQWSSSRVLVWGAFAVLVVISIIALQCTNLATPTVHRVRADHVDGVLLRAPPPPPPRH
jgi:hypothetical protein